VLRKVTLPELKNIHTIVFDFDGVFTNNKVWVDEDGKETVRCDRSDGLGFDLL
jgi:3-deoxy-D-manno-octulosonate 8-phosphate phosphatase KdsC-like HAD superfamily phosphatase